MIELSNVSKYYGDFKALSGITFSAGKGEIIGLLGPNGAGKTTTMRVITGFLSVEEGTVSINGINPEKDPLGAKKSIGYLPENPLFYEEMTIYEFLEFIGRVKQLSDLQKEIYSVMDKTGLYPRRNQLISSLSRGFKQRVGLAAALVGNPPILILDEPTSGLDPNQVVEIRDLIKKMGEEKTIILSSHILSEVEEICKKIILIDKGVIKAVDTVEGLKEQSQGNPSCIIKVENKEKAFKILDSAKQVKSYEEKEDQEGEIEVFLASLDERKELLKELTYAGLYEFYTPKVQLEEVFRQLTAEEKEEVVS